MSGARQRDLISVDDYLTGESQSEIKHEYVTGVVYAMAGGTVARNMIATNILRCVGNFVCKCSRRQGLTQFSAKNKSFFSRIPIAEIWV